MATTAGSPNAEPDVSTDFLFVGDALALDFVNTEIVVRGQPRDLLAAPADLIAWLHAAATTDPAGELAASAPFLLADEAALTMAKAFRAADGWLTIGGANQANWERMVRVLGAPEWLSDPRFRTNADRMANLEALVAAMNARLTTRPVAAWIGALEAEGVPCGPIYAIDQVFADPQVAQLPTTATVESPQLGPLTLLAQPVTLARTPSTITTPPPECGEHTDEVLAEFGYSPSEIAALRRQRIV